jgi:orotate phosphoribosyltransferase
MTTVQAEALGSTTASVYKQDFLALCHAHNILKFGTFKVKSGRISPYFFNAGSFNTASLLSALGKAYAHTIALACEPRTVGQQQQHSDPEGEGGRSSSGSSGPIEFDVLFGPAYKGIPLCAITSVHLAALDGAKFGGKGWCFNRKEAKDHGEGGSLVGAVDLAGKRVLVIDDVVTDGAAKREAAELIRACGGVLAGIVVAVDRQEVVVEGGEGGDGGGRRESALGALRRQYGVPMVAIVTLKDILEYSKGKLTGDEIAALEAYRSRYGSDDLTD